MQELNTTSSVDVIDEDGCDALTVVDMGEMIALSQMAEDGTFHNVIIGLGQAAKLKALLETLCDR